LAEESAVAMILQSNETKKPGLYVYCVADEDIDNLQRMK
jgi:hypothetical protein